MIGDNLTMFTCDICGEPLDNRTMNLVHVPVRYWTTKYYDKNEKVNHPEIQMRYLNLCNHCTNRAIVIDGDGDGNLRFTN